MTMAVDLHWMGMRLWINSTTDISRRALHGHHYPKREGELLTIMILEQCTMNSAILMHRTEIGNKRTRQWTTIMNTGRYTSIEEFSGPELCLLDEDHA